MRTLLLALALIALAGCAPADDEALLCSEDNDCVPADCGPEGCAGGTSKQGSGGSKKSSRDALCDEMCDHVYASCRMALVGPGGEILFSSESSCYAGCKAGTPSQSQARCIASESCGDWNHCLR